MHTYNRHIFEPMLGTASTEIAEGHAVNPCSLTRRPALLTRERLFVLRPATLKVKRKPFFFFWVVCLFLFFFQHLQTAGPTLSLYGCLPRWQGYTVCLNWDWEEKGKRVAACSRLVFVEMRSFTHRERKERMGMSFLCEMSDFTCITPAVLCCLVRV